MMRVTIDKEKCKGCYLCVGFCPKGSLVAGPDLNNKGYKPVIFKEGSQCIGCCFCARICPDCCITIEKD